MGENSKIQWCDHTFNPWRGCQKVAAGCANCYAEAQSKRNTGTLGKWGPNGTRVVAAESAWKQVERWERDAAMREESYQVAAMTCRSEYDYVEPCYPPAIFCGSMCDVFEDWPGEVRDSRGRVVNPRTWRPIESEGPEPATLADVRARLFRLIDATPNLTWLLLTKRPQNIRPMWGDSTILPNVPAEEEEWRSIPGHEPYLASSHGRIKGPRGIVSGDANSTGHIRVTLHGVRGRHRELVHRLVLATFVGPPPGESSQARHLDGNASNNYVGNLCWGSQSDNWGDSKRHGTHRRYSKLSSDDVCVIRSRWSNGESFASIARDFPVSDTQVGNICKGEQWNTLPKRSNCWLGTSIACQDDVDKNIPELLKCRDLCAGLFLSIEPLIGPVDLDTCWPGGMPSPGGGPYAAGIDQVIVGGESGPHSRPCNVDWIRSIARQCDEAGVLCMVKQLGANVIDTNTTSATHFDESMCWPDATKTSHHKVLLRDKKGGDPAEWPEDLRKYRSLAWKGGA